MAFPIKIFLYVCYPELTNNTHGHNPRALPRQTENLIKPDASHFVSMATASGLLPGLTLVTLALATRGRGSYFSNYGHCALFSCGH